ncbi:phosphatase PAP2 family protein [Roseiconus nitratireducens]|uniref:Phosphatase PAP2 family protein n=1 Tax=Roseiconus nitratireducens TaxID=2605748 RepID=A0A5M6D5D7_9BACT|nr:phosphatase PAP2 family protein [Roseiconus nitratireducens]KAA5541790.1 phosphatase PAP2 family protein [Roseiconus nitratireducens]
MLGRFLRWIRGHELATAVLVGIVGAGIWGFVELADEVTEGDSMTLDRQILLSLRQPNDASDPLGPSWFEEMARDVTALGSVVVLMFVTTIVVGYLFLAKQNWVSLFVIVAIVGGTLVSTGMKSAFNRARPDLVQHETEVYTKSFPSGHSAMSALVYLTLGALVARVQPRRKLKVYFLAVAVFLAILVGCSRVYLGVHWPTDVLGGWMFGVTWAAASWLVFRWLGQRFHQNPEVDS